MEHLTIEKIIEFVSLTELNEEAVRLAALVNGHIRHCPECFELVKAFQTIYDEFLECSIENSFSQYIRENSSQLELENKAKSYLQREL